MSRDSVPRLVLRVRKCEIDRERKTNPVPKVAVQDRDATKICSPRDRQTD